MNEFYIIFTKGNNGLLDRLLKTDLGHIILLKLEGDKMTLLNPKSNTCDISNLPNDPGRIINSLNVEHLIYIKVSEKLPKRILSIMTPFTCVKFVKYMVGLKMFALTPTQLYKRLKKEIAGNFETGKFSLPNIVNATLFC